MFEFLVAFRKWGGMKRFRIHARRRKRVDIKFAGKHGATRKCVQELKNRRQ
jgi:hypothetical protein